MALAKGSGKGGSGNGSALFPDSDDEDNSSSTEESEVKFKEKKNWMCDKKLSFKQGTDDDGGGGGFQINKNYAERYDKWRNKEELMKMKARYGTDDVDALGSDGDESSSSSEEEWTEDKEKAFFKTLSNLKKKDPKIYDPNIQFFTTEVVEASSSPRKKSKKKEGADKNDKPFLLKDHERAMILEKGGLISDSEEDEENYVEKKSTLSYYQELDSIKKGFSAALNSIESDDDDNDNQVDDVLLKKGKPKTVEQEKEEDEDYRLWLKGELNRLEKGKLSKEEVKELSFLRSYWNDEKLDEGEKFLRDYILNRKYVEGGSEAKEDSSEDDDTPNYNQIAHDSDEEGLSNDEQFENQREEFEHKYNFRFEEPDPDFIKRFPRTIDDSLRREDERRKKQRDSAKDRKNEAKDRKREEVGRLKAYKRKEIMDKLAQLQQISGNPDLPVYDLDIDGDFDPEEYDKKMKNIFDDEYYTDADQDKPTFPYDPEIDDDVNYEEWAPTDDEESADEVKTTGDIPITPSTTIKKSKKSVPEDPKPEPGQPEPCSSSSTIRFHQELIDISKGRKSNKNKGNTNIFLQVLEKKKPKFDPSLHKSFEQYFKEYYALDFEDLIGDLPCRFKYRKVAPNDFGLSTKEILKAEDRELNQWASLKKTYQYRANEEEIYEAQAYKKKAENENLKKRVLLSMYHPVGSAEGEDEEEKNDEEGVLTSNENSKSKKKKKKDNKKKKSKSKNVEENVEVKEELETDCEPLVFQREENPSSVQIKEEPIEETLGEDQQSPQKLSKRQRKNRRKQNPAVNSTNIPPPQQSSSFNSKQNGDTTKKKHFKPTSTNNNVRLQSGNKRSAEVSVEDERLKAYGINPKKHKKWVKYGGTKD